MQEGADAAVNERRRRELAEAGRRQREGDSHLTANKKNSLNINNASSSKSDKLPSQTQKTAPTPSSEFARLVISTAADKVYS